MIEKQTKLDLVQISGDGNIQLRFGLLLVEGDNVLNTKWHRTAVDVDGDLDAALFSVSKAIVDMGYPAVSLEDLARAKRIRVAAG